MGGRAAAGGAVAGRAPRRTEPDQVAGLHRAAAEWFAGHGYPVQAVRHAQAAQDWDLAARLLADNWPGLYLDGQAATVHGLLAGFPAEASAADAELAAVAAGDELARGSLEAAGRYLGLAERASASVPEGRRGQAQLLLGMVRLLLARQRGDRPAVAEEARRLQALAEAPEAAQAGLGEELRALALISLGSAEYWVARFEEAERHLERGVALARRIGRPYLEFTGLAYQAATEFFRSLALAVDRSRQAAELAERHGWADDRGGGEMRNGLAALRLAQNDPHAAIAALAPVLDGSAPAHGPARLVQAFLLEAIARDALGDEGAAASALERALDVAEPDGVLTVFLLHPVPGLLQRQARQRTAHSALIADILSLLAGRRSAPPSAGPRPLLEPLSDSELRVLRYLPTNLTGPEIAGQLYVSVNTVKFHMRSLYAKLGTHHRAETVALARDLGLLAPSARGAR